MISLREVDVRPASLFHYKNFSQNTWLAYFADIDRQHGHDALQL